MVMVISRSPVRMGVGAERDCFGGEGYGRGGGGSASLGDGDEVA